MSETAKRVFSGVQPSGTLHIGNYAGAIKNWVRLQDEMECFYCIVDYHAMTIPYKPKELQKRVQQVAVDILACGVDPNKCKLFVQSDVPEHTELAWLLGCVAPMGELNRMTQFKEKSGRTDSVNVGLFTYPVLQAADILIYRADTVPVGDDQLQHLELAREIARRFNNTFKKTFPEPQPMLTNAARIMSLQDPTSKMSKSVDGSAIMLGSEESEIRKQIKRAVTGMGEAGHVPPGVANLFTLFELFGGEEKVEPYRKAQEEGTIRYGDLKKELAEVVVEGLAPIKARREELLAQPKLVNEILGDSARDARKVAQVVLSHARQNAGLKAKPISL
jgi:tryptophanyl-tRNA synthetase